MVRFRFAAFVLDREGPPKILAFPVEFHNIGDTDQTKPEAA
jgi:hypothetical protein